MELTTTPALTTSFNPPQFCLDNTFDLVPSGLDTLSNNVYGSKIPTIYQGVTSGCFPENFAPASVTSYAHIGTKTTIVDGTTFLADTARLESFFSPGTCPIAYTTAEVSLADDVPSQPLGPTRLRVTIATCCPISHTLQVNDCEREPSEVTVWINAAATSSLTAAVRVSPIVVAWQSSDIFTESPSRTTIPGFTESSIARTSSEPDLSTGAKAGIGVGAGVGSLLLFLAAFLLLRLRRRRARAVEGNTEISKPSEQAGGVPELDQEGALQEVDGVGRPPEADDKNVRAELEGQ